MWKYSEYRSSLEDFGLWSKSGPLHVLGSKIKLEHAAAAAKSLQSCPTLCDPRDKAPPSLGFSRQEHWSGLPFPSSMHESEKWKWSRSVVSDCFPKGLERKSFTVLLVLPSLLISSVICWLFRSMFWRREWQPTAVLLPGKSHVRRSLVGYSPCDLKVRHDWATSLYFTSLHTWNSSSL